MNECAILATGPSMSQCLVDSLKVPCIAVNDAYRLAPHAVALVANDKQWWGAHAAALSFAGRKFSTQEIKGVETIKKTALIRKDTNSALVALHVALTILGYQRAFLYGLDLSSTKGSHFFGDHIAPLRNTADYRFDIFRKQFADYARQLPENVEMVNCTAGNGLECFRPASQERIRESA